MRDRENEFASYFKYGTVYLVRPLISIGKCCDWVVNNYLVGSETLETETGNMIWEIKSRYFVKRAGFSF